MASLNVKVAVRCRPMSSREVSRGCKTIIAMTDKTVAVSSSTSGDTSQPPKEFTFDHCYYMDSTQEQVYTDLGSPVVIQALEGFNGTIFAYGQTGSGKSWSMMGSEADPAFKGVIPRLNDDLWSKLQEKRMELDKQRSESVATSEPPGETKFMITASFLEIYNEEINDLLNPTGKSLSSSAASSGMGNKKPKKLQIRESPELGIYVDGLYELVVHSSDDLLRLIQQGNNFRHVAATNMNEQSSRSHSCFTIKIEQKTTTDLGGGMTREQIVKAKINLVDLAGSERADKTGATGAVLKEGANINKSLLTLGNVINALAETAKASGPGGQPKKPQHIPYRESELTRLLSESLGGNSATVMIAAISPADYNFDETLSTLKYANRAKSIENAVKRNEDRNDRMIKDLKQEIERLKQQLEAGMAGGGLGGSNKGHDPEVERRLREMEEAQRNAWDEKEKLSKALEEERQANMNTVITQMMQGVKEQKVNHMKNIKKLTNEKQMLNDRFKSLKETNATLKSTLDVAMKKYQGLQGQYDKLGQELSTIATEDAAAKKSMNAEDYAKMKKKFTMSEQEVHAKAEKIAVEMAELLTSIETQRATWTHNRDVLKATKERLAAVDDEVTDERAELVATAGLLDQNDKLRAQIQAEEKEKIGAEMAMELAAERARLENEFAAVRGTMEGEIAVEMDRLKRTITERDKQLKQAEVAVFEAEARKGEIAELESKLADALYEIESLQGDVETLQNTQNEAKDIQEKEKNTWLTEIQQLKLENEKLVETAANASANGHGVNGHGNVDSFLLFRDLMDGFAKERDEWGRQTLINKQLLANATKDLLYLTQQNDRLQRELQQAIMYEPPIRPTTSQSQSQTPSSKKHSVDNKILHG